MLRHLSVPRAHQRDRGARRPLPPASLPISGTCSPRMLLQVLLEVTHLDGRGGTG